MVPSAKTMEIWLICLDLRKYLTCFRLVQDHTSNQDMFYFSKERKKERRGKMKEIFFVSNKREINEEVHT